MSHQWPGGLIRKTPPTPQGPYQDGAAPGVWTLEQMAYYLRQGLWPIAGNTNPDVFIENLFSTYLYTGTGATQTITNGIDLSGKGGLVWIKSRSSGTQNHFLFDTVRGANAELNSNTTDASTTLANSLTAFNGDGFSIGSATATVNSNTATYVSWAFRKQAKFFDVVTYTGNGANRTIAHNLGSVPGCIIIKDISNTSDWQVYHRSLANTEYMVLNSTAAKSTGTTRWNSTTPTSTVFSLGTDSTVNANGNTYVAYLFAHNAGGFGLTGTDNVISCGSFTTNSVGGATVNLGYEPQWMLVRKSAEVQNWFVIDIMRQWNRTTTPISLKPNTAEADVDDAPYIQPNSVGFDADTEASKTYIYIAIRRGPMKVPTSGTSVFGLNARTGTGANATVTGGQLDDAVLIKNRGDSVEDLFAARLTGINYLVTSTTGQQISAGIDTLQANPWDVMDGVKIGTTSTITNVSGNTFINYLFRRAPSFFDVVCYTGTGANQTVNHNLAAVPELMLVKRRSGALSGWQVYSSALANTEYLVLNTTAAKATGATRWNSTTPTSTVFSLGTASEVNASAAPYVAYLFASVAGVSKVGSYTGTGTTLQIDCGFTSGARFVLIKRTNSTGDWYVWDSARGIVAGNDPYLLLNSNAAEVTNTDYVDTYSAGFEISSTAPAAINANGGTFIFLAIA